VIPLTHQPAISRNDAYVLTLAFLFIRFILIAGLYFLSGGKELASDVVFHEIIIGDPLGILKGTAIHIASYPPFQWTVEWPLFTIFRIIFSEMISYRLMMVSVELTSFIVAIFVLRKLAVTRTIALCILVLFIISPHQFFASVFFIQEDVISQLFMMVALLLLVYERRLICITVLVCGVLIAKLFFVVPLFYVIFFQGQRSFPNRMMDGIFAILPLIIIYAFIIMQALNNGGEVPIRDFSPDAKYAANFWVLLINSNAQLLAYYKNVSLILTACVQFSITAVLIYLTNTRKWLWHPAILLALPLAVFFSTFYQQMPEYFLMLWPVVAFFCTTLWQQLLVVGALCFAWAPRISHGLITVVDGFGSSASARADVVGPIIEQINVDFVLLNKTTLIMQSVIYSLLVVTLVFLSRKLQRKHALPRSY